MKAAREKQSVTYKEIPIRLIVYLSSETMKNRRQGKNIFKVLKITTKNCQTRILYSSKLSLNNKCEIKTFFDQHSLREFVAGRPT